MLMVTGGRSQHVLPELMRYDDRVINTLWQEEQSDFDYEFLATMMAVIVTGVSLLGATAFTIWYLCSRIKQASSVSVQLQGVQNLAPIVIVGQSGPTTAITIQDTSPSSVLIEPDCGGYLG